MSRQVLLCCLLWMVAGCARNTRPDSAPATPQYEHVFLKPLEESLEETRKLLEERGYSFLPLEDDTLLLTTWQQPQTMREQRGNTSQFRYVVTGLRVGPRQSVVRIFRIWRAVAGNAPEMNVIYPVWSYDHVARKFEEMDTHNIQRGNSDRGRMAGTRDLDLEKELTLRLESGAGIEVVARDVAPEPERPQLREESFYLDRWKQDVASPTAEVQPCPQQVRGLNALLQPGRTLLIGEQLGSREAPAVVGDMVCQSAAAGLNVVLGLSMPRTEQERINRYLASPGAPSDQDELLRGVFWRRPFQDGRSSRAIMDLIDRIRSLRNYGLFVNVVAYDTDEATGSKRDARLATLWQERRKAHPEELFVILAGNTHTRTVEGTTWDKDFVPMAKRLVENEKSLLAFDLSYAQGSRWGCDLNRNAKLVCTIVGATPTERVAAEPGQSPYVSVFSQPTEEGYHGLLYVGALTPSLPATSLKGHELPAPSTLPRELPSPLPKDRTWF